MPRTFVIALFLLAFSTTTVRGQTLDDTVRAALKTLLDGLANADTVALLATSDSAAKLVSVMYRNGHVSLAYIPMRAIITSVARSSVRRREQIRNERVWTTSDLATVAADYDFYFNDVIDHCGAVMYDFVRVQGQWRVVQIRQTDRRDGCGPPR